MYMFVLDKYIMLLILKNIYKLKRLKNCYNNMMTQNHYYCNIKQGQLF